MTVRSERTLWRDQKLSERHRKWGFDCPMVDIDFLVVEYDYSNPKALIEYKNEHAKINFNKLTTIGMAPQSYKALEYLANNSEIPFFVVRYKDDFSLWNITPMNKIAEIYSKHLTKIKSLNEQEYIDFLYFLRDRPEPEEVFHQIIEEEKVVS